MFNKKKRLIKIYFFMFSVGILLSIALILIFNQYYNDKDIQDADNEENVIDKIKEIKGTSNEESFDESFPLIIPEYTNSNEIIIPKLQIISPILHGQDSNTLLKRGFWSLPSSGEVGKEEIILLCHRRFFGRGTAKSCWDINTLRNGDDILIKLKDEKQINYKVEDTTIVSGKDNSIYNISNINRLKLISCSTSDGDAGSNEYRIIITAVPI